MKLFVFTSKNSILRFSFLGLVFISFLILISNASGVPQAVSGSPVEFENNSCGTCHDEPGPYVASVKMEIFNPDLSIATRYTPGNTYQIRVAVSGTNNPKSYGFQLSCIDINTKNDLGNWVTLGNSVRQQNLTIQQKLRKYLVQSNPKADGIFTTSWKAPSTNVGDIHFYFAGQAVNLNGSTSGDNFITGQLILPNQSVSSNIDYSEANKISIFPNPTCDLITINYDNLGDILMYDGLGKNIMQCTPQNGSIDVSYLPVGKYYIDIKNQNGKMIARKSFSKI